MIVCSGNHTQLRNLGRVIFKATPTSFFCICKMMTLVFFCLWLAILWHRTCQIFFKYQFTLTFLAKALPDYL